MLDALAGYLGISNAAGAVRGQSLISGLWCDREQPFGASGIVRGERLCVSVGRNPSAGARLVRWSVRSPEITDRGRVRVHRPPRTSTQVDDFALALPTKPVKRARHRFPLGAMAIPLVIGALLVLVTRRPEVALFSLFSPVMVVWNYLDERRARKSDYRTESEYFDRTLHRLVEDARAHALRWITSMAASYPTPAELASSVTALTERVYQRRAADADFLSLEIGRTTRQVPAHVADPYAPRDDPEDMAAVHAALTVSGAPVVLDLTSGSVALVGSGQDADGLLRWLIAQLSVLHSPADVALAFALSDTGVAGGDDSWAWCRWLPQLTQDLDCEPVANGRAEGSRLIAAVLRRGREREQSAGPRAQPSGRVLVLVLQASTGIDPAQLDELLRLDSAAGVRVIWLGADGRLVPGLMAEVVQIEGDRAYVTVSQAGAASAGAAPSGATPSSMGASAGASGVVVTTVSQTYADALVAAPAPLVDAAFTDANTTLAGTVLLAELIADLGSPSARRRAWEAADGTQLWCQLGVTADGPLRLDLGPSGSHVLIAGTTGAGKSELLQSMVTSLAAQYPPTRVAFLLVDYKGGAAFKDAIGFPHTVGLVTDLDQHLAKRVLRALEAEIHRREQLLLAAGARDILELRRSSSAPTPPDLLILVDEFAALAKEVPEFVEGMVDIAARGRSLGLRLVLATQRPAGVISERIRANVGVRIALRVNDENDSLDVIDSRLAAHLSPLRPGRGYLRMHREVVEFQAAYVGSTAPRSEEAVVRVRALDASQSQPRQLHPATERTDLQAAVEAAEKVMRLGRWPAPRAPWLPALGEVITLAELADELSAADSTAVVLGKADQPALQRQPVLGLDFAQHPHLLVFGTSRSGKTTLLRTIAAGLIERFDSDELNLYVLDFAGQGLQALVQAPQCGGVLSSDDLGRVLRLFGHLRRTIDARKRLMSATGVSSYSELVLTATATPLPRVVILLDSYAGASAALERLDGGRALDQLHRLVSEAAACGVHFVITADRRAVVPASLTSIITTRVVLRMAERDDYLLLGVDPSFARDRALPAGRAVIGGDTEVQLAVCSSIADAQAQSDELRHRASTASARATGRNPVVQIGAMPDVVARSELPAPSLPAVAALGIGSEQLAVWWVDLEHTNFLVTGPRRSGRSTALLTIAESLWRYPDPAALVLVCGRRSPLSGLGRWNEVFVEPADAFALTDAIAGHQLRNRPVVLICDDVDELGDPVLAGLEQLVRASYDRPIRIVAAADNRAALRSYSGPVPELRKAKQGLLLNPDLDLDGDLLGVRLRAGVESTSGPGRGFAVKDGVAELVQVGI